MTIWADRTPPLSLVSERLLRLVFGLGEAPMALLQRLLRMRRLPWAFLAPNLVVFAIFTFLPIIINVYYALAAQLVPGRAHDIVELSAGDEGDDLAAIPCVMLRCSRTKMIVTGKSSGVK
jgi:hypothetical protein